MSRFKFYGLFWEMMKLTITWAVQKSSGNSYPRKNFFICNSFLQYPKTPMLRRFHYHIQYPRVCIYVYRLFNIQCTQVPIIWGVIFVRSCHGMGFLEWHIQQVLHQSSSGLMMHVKSIYLFLFIVWIWFYSVLLHSSRLFDTKQIYKLINYAN